MKKCKTCDNGAMKGRTLCYTHLQEHEREKKKKYLLKAKKVVKKPKKKKESKSALIKKLDKVFSIYIRQRDKGVCISCGVKKDWKLQQNGHYISRGNFSTRWDEINCNCQCLTKESNLRLFNGCYKSIKDIRKGDVIWGFNKIDFEREVSIVENVSSFLPDELYEVELENGERFFSTGDHKVVANKKWISIEDLLLHNCIDYDIMEL